MGLYRDGFEFDADTNGWVPVGMTKAQQREIKMSQDDKNIAEVKRSLEQLKDAIAELQFSTIAVIEHLERTSGLGQPDDRVHVEVPNGRN